MCAVASPGGGGKNIRVGRGEVSIGVGVVAQQTGGTFETHGEYFDGRDVRVGRRFDA